jgi:predicted O-linked N-acetylglucosamine transferase (SPINDLY family)
MNLAELARRAVEHYRRGDLRAAEQAGRLALAAAPHDPNLLQLLAAVLVAKGHADQAADLLESAIKKITPTPEVLYNLGTALAAAGRHKRAAQCLQQACSARPLNADYHNNLGSVLLGLRRYTEAETSLARALELRPDWPVALYNKGRAAAAQGHHQDAVEIYARAVCHSKPVPAEFMFDMGYSCHMLNRHDQALACYDRAIILRPDYAEAYNDRGNTLLLLQRPAEALASFDRALTLKPRYAEARYNRGNALIHLNCFSEALASFEGAIALKPEYAEAYNGRGIALFRLNRAAEALASCDRALAINPQYADAHHCRGNALVDLGRLMEALASYGRALATKPDASQSLAAYVYVARDICDWTAAEDARQALLESCCRPTFRGACFPILTICDDPEIQLAAAQNFVRNTSTSTSSAELPNIIEGRRKIRVGYLSADFRNHPTSYLIAELIEIHDRTAFEVFGFSSGLDDQSPMRTRMVKAFDVFKDMHGLSDQDLARAVREANIDILVDLGGHTRESRMLALTTRLAPIQATYLGYPATTGAHFIDYAIVDKFIIAEGMDKFFTEKLAYLPDCYQVNDRKRAVSTLTPSRADCELPENAFIFCCFNHANKIGPNVFDVWMRILTRVPNSVLWLLHTNGWMAQNLRKEAEARGVDPKRLVFAPKQDLSDHLARMRLANLFLDTWPYNAHTTGSDALWTGLPLLTYPGRSFASRVAGSLLRAFNMADLIATSLDDYETLAVKLATEPWTMASLTQRMRSNRDTAALFNTNRFRHHIEAALVHMWDQKCRRGKLESFSVPPIEL